MPTYLVESYMPGASARHAAAAAARAGTDGALHRWSLVITAEEVCLHVFDAASVDVVRDAVTRAALRCQRISEVVVVLASPVEIGGG